MKKPMKMPYRNYPAHRPLLRIKELYGKKMKLTLVRGIIIVLLCFLLGCSSINYQTPHYVKIAHKITETTAIKLEKEKKTLSCRYRWGNDG